jgi:hypothetical protein
MTNNASTAAATSSQELTGEFRADPAAHWPIIGVLAVLALLSLVGVGWLIVKPGPVDVGRVLTAVFLFILAGAFLAGLGYYWLRMARWIRLEEKGLTYFDGRQTHNIRWDDVQEVYEVISSVKLLGITVDAPQFALSLVTSGGVRCEIDKDIRGCQTLGPLVSREVNRSLSQRARHKLARRESVPFGAVSLSEAGVRIEEPAALPWWETLKHKLEGQAQPRFAVPGQYAWQQVRAIQIVPAMEGSKWADHTTYNQLQIQGLTSPLYGCPVPLFPNFAVFTETLDALNRPLVRAEAK